MEGGDRGPKRLGKDAEHVAGCHNVARLEAPGTRRNQLRKEIATDAERKGGGGAERSGNAGGHSRELAALVRSVW